MIQTTHSTLRKSAGKGEQVMGEASPSGVEVTPMFGGCHRNQRILVPLKVHSPLTTLRWLASGDSPPGTSIHRKVNVDRVILLSQAAGKASYLRTTEAVSPGVRLVNDEGCTQRLLEVRGRDGPWQQSLYSHFSPCVCLTNDLSS